MIGFGRPLVIAAALYVTFGGGIATGQTVFGNNVPPGTTVELIVNTTTVGTAKAGADRVVRFTFDVNEQTGRPETDAQLYVDFCGELRRMLIVARGMSAAPQQEGCDRREVPGLFLVRRVSTLVFDIASPPPGVLLRQAAFDPLVGPRIRRPPPTGLVLFGGGGLSTYRDVVTLSCGNVEPCDGEGSRPTFAVGAAFWMGPYVAAEGSYLRPGEGTASGSGANFQFDSGLDAHVLTLGGKAGVPAGSVRIFGQAGANYHRATFTTTQMVDPADAAGSTQIFTLETGGWGWQLGAGMEAWVAPAFALYGEFNRVSLRGDARNDVDGALDERIFTFLIGARVRIGR